MWECGYISSQVVICTWMRFKPALLRRSFICIRTNNMFQLRMLMTKWVLVQFPNKIAQGMLPISTYTTPSPLVQVPTAPASAGIGDICPCIIDGNFETVMGAFRTYHYYHCNLCGSRRHSKVSWPLLAVFSGQWPAFKRNSPPQRPRQPSAAAPHILFVGVQATPGPASAPDRFFKPLHFRSSPTDCLVEALSVPFAGLPLAQPSAAALHSTILFKRLNPPQWRCTLSCWRLKTSNP